MFLDTETLFLDTETLFLDTETLFFGHRDVVLGHKNVVLVFGNFPSINKTKILQSLRGVGMKTFQKCNFETVRIMIKKTFEMKATLNFFNFQSNKLKTNIKVTRKTQKLNFKKINMKK